MKQLILSILFLPVLASANTLSINAGFTTDYVARGTSQTLGNEAYQFGIDYTFDNGFYAGVWTSNVDFGDGTDQEIDGWIGWRKSLNALNTLDLSFSLFAYTNDPVPYEMVEFKTMLTQAKDKWSVTETLAYSPDYFDILDQSVWGELAFGYQLTDKLGLSASVGYQYIQGGGSYGCYSVGASYKLQEHLSVDLKYYDTNDHGQGKAWESRFSLSLKTTF